MNTLSKILDSIINRILTYLNFQIEFGLASVQGTNGQTTNTNVTFSKAFTETPTVIVGRATSSPNACQTSVYNLTTTGFVIRCYSTWTGIYGNTPWIAIGRISTD